MTDTIVCDTGPLISLEKMNNGYSFIKKLYKNLIIPPAVLDELCEHHSSPEDYFHKYQINQFIKIINVDVLKILNAGKLHDGERQAISLAHYSQSPLLIEEKYGRTIAQTLGISVSGMAKQIHLAYSKGHIKKIEAEEMLQSLLQSNRINQKVYDLVWNKIVNDKS